MGDWGKAIGGRVGGGGEGGRQNFTVNYLESGTADTSMHVRQFFRFKSFPSASQDKVLRKVDWKGRDDEQNLSNEFVPKSKLN